MKVKGYPIIFLVGLGIFLAAPAKSQFSHSSEARKALDRAAFFFEKDSFELAYHTYDSLATYFQSTGDCYQEAYARLWKGEVLYAFGLHDKALSESLLAEGLLDSCTVPDTVQYYSLLLQNIGVFYYYATGKLEQQLQYYKRSFEQALNFHGPASREASDAYFSMGAAYGRRKQMDAFIAYTDTAVQIAKAIDYKEGLSDGYNNLAYAFAAKNDYLRAVSYYRKAHELAENALDRSTALNNIGAVYNEAGLPERALDPLREALQIREPIYGREHYLCIGTRHNIADAYFGMEEYDRSLEELEDLTAILEASSTPDFGHLKRAYIRLASVYLILKDPHKAETYVQKGLALNVPALNPSLYYVMAAIAMATNEPSKGLEAIDQALHFELPEATYPVGSLPKFKDISTYNSILDLLALRAQILEKLGRTSGQSDYFVQTIRTTDLLDSVVFQARQMNQDVVSRKLLSANIRDYYLAGIAASYQLYQQIGAPIYFEKGLLFSDLNKFAELGKRMDYLSWESKLEVSSQTLQREQTLRQEIDFLTEQIAYQRGYLPDSILNSWQNDVFINRKMHRALLDTLAQEYPEYFTLRYGRSNDRLETIRRDILEEKEALLEYHLQEGRGVYLLYVDQHTTKFLFSESMDLKVKVMAFREALYTQDTAYLALARELYQTLVSPLEEALERVEGLAISPDGYLATIPFEALLTKPIEHSQSAPDFRHLPYLLKEYRTRYLFAAGIAGIQEEASARRNRFEGRVLAFAPEFTFSESEMEQMASADLFRSGLSPLTGNEMELKEIGKHFSGRFLRGDKATESAFKRLAPQYQVLHLATHAIAEENSERPARLIFSEQGNLPGEDGILFSQELLTMQLKAELVTLSACNTGVGRIDKGEGVASLARAFAYSGAPNLVMSLWQVKDRTTAQLMAAFYEQLGRGLTKGKALHQAKVEYLDQSSSVLTHPYYWAGFVYVGDKQALSLQRDPVKPALLAFVLAALAGGILFFFLRKRKSNLNLIQ